MSKKKKTAKLLEPIPIEVGLLETSETGNISDRRWKKMQNKDFRKQVIKKFGLPTTIVYLLFIIIHHFLRKRGPKAISFIQS